MSFLALAVVANWDDFVAGFEEGISGDSALVEETGGDAGTTDEVDPADFTALDDASLAAILADADAAYGQAHIVYGEVQQMGDDNAPCAAYILIDDAKQSSIEGYAVPTVISAASGDTVCPEFDGLAELSHIKAWVTVVGSTNTELEDGTTADILMLELHQYEALPELP